VIAAGPYGPGSGSLQFVQQPLRLFEVGRVEAFGEPVIYRREQVAGLGMAALVAAEPGEAHSGAQFPELCFLLPSDVEGLAKQLLGNADVS